MKLMRHILVVIAFCCIGYVYSQSDAENERTGRPIRLRSLLNPDERKKSVKEALRRLSNVPIPHPGVAKIDSTERAIPLGASEDSEAVLRSALQLVTTDEESALIEESSRNSDLAADEAMRSTDEEKVVDEEINTLNIETVEPRSETIEALEAEDEEKSMRTFHHHHHHSHGNRDRDSDGSKSPNSLQPTFPDPNQQQQTQATKPICFTPINMGTWPNIVSPGGGDPNNNIMWAPNNNNNPSGSFVMPNMPWNPNGNNNNPTYLPYPFNFGNIGSLGLGPNLCITPCQNTQQNGGSNGKNNPNEDNQPGSVSQVITGGTHGAGIMGEYKKEITAPINPNLNEVVLNNPLENQLRSAVVAEPSAPVPPKVDPRFLPRNYRYPAYPGYYQQQLMRPAVVNPYSAYQQYYRPHHNLWY